MSFTKEYAQLVQEQKEMFPFIHPLLCGLEFNQVNRQEPRSLSEYNFLRAMAKEKGWKELPAVLEPLHDPATAIVVTDAEEQIEWVSEGFFHMTGYQPEEVQGRNPNFLQGKETSPEDIGQIRQLVNKNEPFSAVILNYRKNGEPYNCKIRVYPIFSRQQELVNFLAVENEVPAEAVRV